MWPAPGDGESWTAPQDGWPAPAGNGWHSGAEDDWTDDTAAGTGWPQAAPDETALQNSWPRAAPDSHRPGTGPGWPHDTPDHHRGGPVSEYPWPDDAGTNWPDDAGTNWPDGTGGAANWPSATGSSAHGQNGTGSSANAPSWIGSAWPNEASTAADSWPIAPGDAGQQAAGDRPADPELAGDERLAMLCYLSVPFLAFLLPLVIYVLKGRRPGFVHGHAAQALNLSITALLYTFCVLIVGTILALDTISVALLIGVPLVAALWIATLGYVVRAGAAASRGGYFRIPAWICATIAR